MPGMSMNMGRPAPEPMNTASKPSLNRSSTLRLRPTTYQHPSFIEIKAHVEGDQLHFSCQNSKAEKSNEEKGGVGLVNVKQRLKLLYDNNYTLKIHDFPDIYSVQLVIPLNSEL